MKVQSNEKERGSQKIPLTKSKNIRRVWVVSRTPLILLLKIYTTFRKSLSSSQSGYTIPTFVLLDYENLLDEAMVNLIS